MVPAGLLCAPSIAAGAGVVNALAPDHARGFVIGLHTSSLTAGGAAASAFTGLLIDRWSPGTAVLVVGTLGIVAALLSWALARASPRSAATPPGPSARSKPTRADSAAMNASPACALRENVLHETVQWPSAPRPRGACPVSPQRAAGRGADQSQRAASRGAGLSDAAWRLVDRPSAARRPTERPDAAGCGVMRPDATGRGIERPSAAPCRAVRPNAAGR